jgi:hypothetical protein
MRETKRRKIENDDPKSFFVLVGGEARQSQGSPDHNEREFLHTSVPFVGQAYQCLRDAGVSRERIITICQLNDYHAMLKMGEEGRLTQRRTGTIEPRFFRKQLEETNRQCQLLLAEGGADYDYEMVNPETVLAVLVGEQSRTHPRVVPKSCTALFFAIYSHGDSHSTTTTHNHEHNHSRAEWFAHFPYPSPRRDIYDFVATDGAGKEDPYYYLYSTQLRLVFHRLFSENPNRPIVGLLNYCTSGGNLEFMRRPAVVQNLGVDQWPLFLMSSSGKSVDSLVAGFWQSVFQLFSSSLRGNHRHTLQSLFDAAVCAYHQENLYDLLNECKERAYSSPVWQLDFRRQEDGVDCDPWHHDLRECLLDQNGKPNTAALHRLQRSYASGEAYRVVHRTSTQAGDWVASLPGVPPEYVVIRARNGSHGGDSQPYPCPIRAWQGENAGLPVDLASEVWKAFHAIARPEFVCGMQSGMPNASIGDIFSF